MIISATQRFGALQLVRASEKTLRDIYDNTNHSMAWFALEKPAPGSLPLHALVTGARDVEAIDQLLAPVEAQPEGNAQAEKIKALIMECVEKHFGIPAKQSWGACISQNVIKLKNVGQTNKIDFTDNQVNP